MRSPTPAPHEQPAPDAVAPIAWLFDVDGTLLLTDGAGRQAMAHAFYDVFGVADDLRDVPFAGRTDPLIVADALRKHAIGFGDGLEAHRQPARRDVAGAWPRLDRRDRGGRRPHRLRREFRSGTGGRRRREFRSGTNRRQPAKERERLGPRPERPEFVATLEKAVPYYAWRHAVRPGLTGWAQINYPYGSSVEDSVRKLEYDLYYIRNFSLATDLFIVLRTLAAAMRGAR